MDVEIDPKNDKASQGDDAEPHPTPRQAPACGMETGPSADGVREGDQGGSDLTP